jgi:hypothetical protein
MSQDIQKRTLTVYFTYSKPTKSQNKNLGSVNFGCWLNCWSSTPGRVRNFLVVTARTIKKKTRKETNLKFYKIMAVPVLLYDRKNMNTEKERLEQISSGRDEIFKNS